MSRRRLLALWVAVASAAPAVARAEVSPALAEGPLEAVAALSDAGLIRRAAPRTEVALALRPAAIIDTPGFYGMISAGLALEASYAIAGRAEIFGTLTALQYRFVQNATLKGTELSLGEASAGAAYRFSLAEGRIDATPYLRLVFPTSREYAWARPLALEPGLALGGPLPARFAWHAGAALPLSAMVSDGGPHPQAFLSALAGASWTPLAWLEAVLELSARFGPLDLLDQLSAGVGVRFAIGKVGLELGALFPLAGATRYDGAGVLRATYRLD